MINCSSLYILYKSHFGEFDWFISCICSIIRVLINIGDKNE